MDKVLTDEQAIKLTQGEDNKIMAKLEEIPIPALGLKDIDDRLKDLEGAMKIVMGFFNTVLPVDFERYLKKEYKGAERASDVKELKV